MWEFDLGQITNTQFDIFSHRLICILGFQTLEMLQNNLGGL